MVLKVKEMCQPSQIVVAVAFMSLAFEIFQTRGMLSINNIFVIATMFVYMLSFAVMADIYCQNGYEKFAWIVIVMTFLMFVGADRLLQKGWDSMTIPRKST
jgi:hypothetical protein